MKIYVQHNQTKRYQYYLALHKKCELLEKTTSRIGEAIGMLEDYLLTVDLTIDKRIYSYGYTMLVRLLVRRNLPICKKIIAKHVKRTEELL